MMNHLILLGDSILDNGAYTAGGSAVIKHVQKKLPDGWRASLLAVDGSLAGDIEQQLAKLPSDATHLVVSLGGNHALLQSGFLTESAHSVAADFSRMNAIMSEIEQTYHRTLKQVLAYSLPTVICTVYYPNFADDAFQQLSSMGLMPFNDCIMRAAITCNIPVVDLRQVCTTPGDYANEIEPSVAGGEKIARAILNAITTHDFSMHRTTIYR